MDINMAEVGAKEWRWGLQDLLQTEVHQSGGKRGKEIEKFGEIDGSVRTGVKLLCSSWGR